jgi:hypothetical protein
VPALPDSDPHRPAPQAAPRPGAGAALPLWPLALLAGLLPLAGALAAWAVSTQQQLIPACNPFVDGCVSVSRAARVGLPNLIFQALMVPAATLQGLVWLLAARWLHAGLGPTRGVRWLAPLGVTAAVALVVYATFLGTEGAAYRFMRQYGTVVYFGFTCLCLLLAGGAVQQLAARGALHLPVALERAMLVLAATLVALGLGNAFIGAAFGEPWKGRVENVTEWWGSLLFVLGFFALAAMWRRLGLGLTLQTKAPAAPAAAPPAPNPAPAPPR